MTRKNFIKKGFVAVFFMLLVSISGCGAIGSDSQITQMNQAFLPDATNGAGASSEGQAPSPADGDLILQEENQLGENGVFASENGEDGGDTANDSGSGKSGAGSASSSDAVGSGGNGECGDDTASDSGNGKSGDDTANGTGDSQNVSGAGSSGNRKNSSSAAGSSGNKKSGAGTASGSGNRKNGSNASSNSVGRKNSSSAASSNGNRKSDNTGTNGSGNGKSAKNNAAVNKSKNANTSKPHKNTAKPAPTKKPGSTPVPTVEQKVCTISIDCKTILHNMDKLNSAKKPFVPEDGIILPKTSVKLQQGDTVFDILSRVCKERDIHMEASYTPLYGTYYIEGIHQLYEFDCGKDMSGWKYFVNGVSVNYSCSKYEVKAGDSICWSYTCDGGKDLEDGVDNP